MLYHRPIIVSALVLVFLMAFWPVLTKPLVTPRLQTEKLPAQVVVAPSNFQTIKVKDQQLRVEVVDSASAMTLGLSGRDQIGSDGMLFILPRPQVARFWMKDMKFDLDLVWLGQGRILAITAQVPAPDGHVPDHQLPIYTSPPQTDMVLEVVAGWAQTHGWQAGDQVVLW